MFKLMDLPYAYDALEPFIDALTVETHHLKHHAGYVAKLNSALEGKEKYLEMPIEDLLLEAENFEATLKTAVLNNGGQVYNHNLYFESMAPSTGKNLPSAEINTAINQNFGGFEDFKKTFSEAGATQFGSGWAWLSVNSEGKLEIEKTTNADTPLLRGKKPILTMDVWEHAYYLKYKNLRPNYIEAFFEVINWEEVNKKFLATKA